MKIDIKTHPPRELLVKHPMSGNLIVPGHLVGHTDDPCALGMVIGRTSSTGDPECAVLWSESPDITSIPIPTQETWTKIVNTDGSITYDLEAVYDQSTITQSAQSALIELARRAEKTDISMIHQGLILVKMHNVHRM